MWKERFKKVRDAVVKFTSDPRFKWYQRAVWALSFIWAGVVVAQSVSYYTYIGNGKSAQQHGQYQQAQDLFELALNDVKHSLSYALIGSRDSRYANAMNNLAELHRVTGRYSDAEKTYIEVRAVAQKYPGRKSEAYAVSTNNLAALYRDLAKYEQCEQLYKESLQVWENDLKRTTDTRYAASLNGLAKLYRDQGRYQEAEKLYQQALDIRIHALGREHQDAAEIMGNLAGLYRDQRKFADSEKLYLQALEIDRRLLGETHPYVATDMNNLGGLYRDMGRYKQAYALYNKALSLREATLGKFHPYVAKSLLGLSENYRQDGGQYAQSEPLVLRAIEIDRKAFGQDHPDYATACDTAFNLYFQKGDLESAKKYNDAALRVREKLLAPTHPDLVTSRKNQQALLKKR